MQVPSFLLQYLANNDILEYINIHACVRIFVVCAVIYFLTLINVYKELVEHINKRGFYLNTGMKHLAYGISLNL